MFNFVLADKVSEAKWFDQLWSWWEHLSTNENVIFTN